MSDEPIIDQELITTKGKLLGSLLAFTKVFYELRTSRQYKISNPIGRQAHAITICKELTSIFYSENPNLIIQIPPRYGKTELMIHFVAWCLARYPDSNFLYLSYSHSLASKQTETIRSIIEMPYYRKLFHVELSESTAAKDHFMTTAGGSVYASGFGGSITGFGAGIRGVTERFGGCIIVDDAHKPDEVSSDTIREGVIEAYTNTIPSRRNNGTRTPIVAIAQSLHEDDLMERLKRDGGFNQIILPALDVAGNALDPSMHTAEDLKDMERVSPYFFASQMQQCPQPSGGGIFKPEWLPILDEEPKIISTFITADTAETDKTYNDATVFSFWGLYKVIQSYTEIDLYALHWINCLELWCEPKDLESEFMQFYAGCMRHHIKPQFAAIERKSTGTTLVSILDRIQGVTIIKIERTSQSGSKTNRFLEIQPYIASKLVSLPFGAKHTKMCIEHMRKITANDSHLRDDICDTVSDAVKIALIDKTLIYRVGATNRTEKDKTAKILMSQFNRLNQIRSESLRK